MKRQSLYQEPVVEFFLFCLIKTASETGLYIPLNMNLIVKVVVFVRCCKPSSIGFLMATIWYTTSTHSIPKYLSLRLIFYINFDYLFY
jgi:hypothetical protein